MGITIPRVGNCCGCFSLETGGRILGWLTAIFSALGAIVFAAIFIMVLVAPEDVIDKNQEGYTTMVAILAITCGIGALYECFLLFAAIRLLKGITNRNHRQMKLYLVVMVIGAVLSVIGIFTNAATVTSFVSALISAALSVYFTLCIYSLYMKYKDEEFSGQQQSQPYYT